MHDTQLEDRLRAVLHEEGDRLALHVDVQRLEAEMQLRHRARTGRRLGLLAAAIGIVAVGTALAVSGGFLGEPVVGTDPSPTPSPVASAAPVPSEPAPTVITGLARLEPVEGATVLMEIPPSLSGAGATHRVDRPEAKTAYTRIWISCVGRQPTEDVQPDIASVIQGEERSETACLPGDPFALSRPLTDQPESFEITIPADVSYAVLAEAVPVPTELAEPGGLDAPPQIDASSPITVPDWTLERGVTVTTQVGTLEEAFDQQFAIACLGPGSLSFEMGLPGSNPAIEMLTGGSFDCTGEERDFAFAMGMEGELVVWVTADQRTAWHMLATSSGEVPEFTPPSLRLRTEDGDGQDGFYGCDYTWDLGGTGRKSGECDQPDWPEMTDVPPIFTVRGRTLVAWHDPAWTLASTTVRAAQAGLVGQPEPPREVLDLEWQPSTDGLLEIPVDLPAGRWVIRIDTEGTNGPDEFGASYFFLVDVAP